METINYKGRYTSAILTFTEADGAPADAAAVTMVHLKPDGTQLAPASLRHVNGTGLYYFTFAGSDLDQLGLHRAVWTITGDASVAGGTHVDTFIVSSV